jgi:hypothetical protein
MTNLVKETLVASLLFSRHAFWQRKRRTLTGFSDKPLAYVRKVRPSDSPVLSLRDYQLYRRCYRSQPLVGNLSQCIGLVEGE